MQTESSLGVEQTTSLQVESAPASPMEVSATHQGEGDSYSLEAVESATREVLARALPPDHIAARIRVHEEYNPESPSITCDQYLHATQILNSSSGARKNSSTDLSMARRHCCPEQHGGTAAETTLYVLAYVSRDAVTGRVTTLALPNITVSGLFPDVIDNLMSLTKLNLCNTSDNFPSFLYAFTYLYLSVNSLPGELPTDIDRQGENLTYLVLDINGFTGEVLSTCFLMFMKI